MEEGTRSELEKLDGVEKVSFYRSRSNAEQVYYQNTSFSGAIYGIDRAYFSVQGYQLTQGRGFLEGDYEKCRKVAILDEKAVSSLFPEGGPIGRILEIKGDTFTVVGVVAKMETFTPKIESIQVTTCMQTPPQAPSTCQTAPGPLSTSLTNPSRWQSRPPAPMP